MLVIRRVVALFVASAVFFVGGNLNAVADAATNNVTAAGDAVVNQTVAIDSRFSAPGGASGTYLVDTEVFNSSNNRVAQWFENVYLDNSVNTRRYSWNLSGQSVGNYRFAQGIFQQNNWGANRSWESNAGSVSVRNEGQAQQPGAWNLTASASSPSMSEVRIAANFVVPQGFSGREINLDTEVATESGQKVAQWVEKTYVNSGQSLGRTYTWNAGAVPTGKYVVRLGAFSTDWSQSFAWNGSAATLVQSGSGEQQQQQQQAPSTGNPFANSGIFVRPGNPAQSQANAWRSHRPGDAQVMDRISNGGVAMWVGGWTNDPRGEVSRLSSEAAAQGRLPVFVVYNIPNRDCGQHSGGGANGADAYRNFVRSIAAGFGNNKAVVVLEPDALGQLDCLDSWRRNERLSLLGEAVSILGSNGKVSVYLDAGHPGWHAPSEMATRLRNANVANARGFALNVANYSTTSENINYGNAISGSTGGKKFVVDTSRNGRGGNGQWCNAQGRALGPTPTGNTGNANADAFLWVKQPGESDGYCNGGPGAGQWWADYGLSLGRNAGY